MRNTALLGSDSVEIAELLRNKVTTDEAIGVNEYFTFIKIEISLGVKTV